MAYLAQPEQQQLEWLDDGPLAIVLDGKAANGPAWIEGMFRYAGRDRATPRPEGFGISPARMAEGADKFGQIILGPPR
jgi:hypothetical protein